MNNIVYSHPGQPEMQVEVILASAANGCPHLYTIRMRYPRIIHGEIMTHRVFCLAGDVMLDFDLPGGQHGKDTRRVHSMSLREFADKWINGAAEGQSSRHSLKSRLSKMQIRQVNEHTGEVQTSTVKDVIVSGKKEVFRVSAGSFSVCGSKDHRVFTSSGWKRIEDIVPGKDRVITYCYGTGENADPNRYNKIDGRWVQTWARQNRSKVAHRQNHKCAVTGELLERSFHLHHVKPRHERPDLAFDLDNVIAVNPDAHKDLHEEQGWQVGVPLGTVGTLVDSVVSEGECDTYDLEIDGEFPNFFADGVVVHNSRNARSSRAVPVKTMLNEVRNTPFVPWHWGKNQSGMQADEECNELVNLKPFMTNAAFDPFDLPYDLSRENTWRYAAEHVVRIAEAFMNAGYHKQIPNRLLEPFSWIDTLITATQWDNFLWLRQHHAAEPHLQDLANLVAMAIECADVQNLASGDWHLPYITEDDWHAAPEKDAKEWLCKISAARCARISYKPFDGDASYRRELERADLLMNDERVHASPFEHQAKPDIWNGDTFVQPHLHGNLTGWCQYRKLIPNEVYHG